MCVTPSKRSELQVRPAYRKRRATLADVRARSVAARLLMVVSASCAGCAKKDASAEGPPPAVAVKTIVAENATIPDESEYLATLKSRNSATINPQVEGSITKIFVKSGDRVAAGKSLMEIDPIKQQATLQSQTAARSAQEATLSYAKVQLEREKKLFDAGLVATR